MFYSINSINAFVGSSNSGKTYCLIKLLQYGIDNNYINVNNGLILTASKYSEQFKDFKNIFDGSDDYESILSNYLKYILLKKKENKDETHFIVFDDMLPFLKFNSKILKDMFCNYRHYKLYIFITLQQASYIGSLLKQQINHYFIFNTQHITKRSIINLYECVGYNDYKNDKEFIEFLNGMIGGVKHKCVYVDMTIDNKTLKYEPFLA